MTHSKYSLCYAALLSVLLVACTPHIVKEPYKVTEVREVYRPIPDEYTRQLETPQLPDTLTVLDLVQHIKAWQAWGKVANEHRGKVKKLAAGSLTETER